MHNHLLPIAIRDDLGVSDQVLEAVVHTNAHECMVQSLHWGAKTATSETQRQEEALSRTADRVFGELMGLQGGGCLGHRDRRRGLGLGLGLGLLVPG